MSVQVTKVDAATVGGCMACDTATGPVFVTTVARTGSAREMRFCPNCASELLAEIAFTDRTVVADAAKRGNGSKKTGKARQRRQQQLHEATAIACPLCKAAADEPCVKHNGLSPDSGTGVHYSRVSEYHRDKGDPTTKVTTYAPRGQQSRVRDMAPHVPARRKQSRRIPAPYKAARP